MNKPFVLLLVTGLGLGLNFPLGRIAAEQGIDPFLWAGYICLAVSVVMLSIQGVAASRLNNRGELLRFSLISGALSYVVPNGLTFFLIPKIGSGLAAIMFALSPVFTAVLSLLLRVRPPNRLMLLGITFGLMGAVIIILGRSHLGLQGGRGWLLLALLIPLFLGFGNVYRTTAWPKGAPPRLLAASTNLAAALPLLLLYAATAESLSLSPLLANPALLAGQLAASTIMFLTFFRLQEVGGPTYLSQIGYVAAAVGLLIGVTVFGETYPWSVWTGAGVIAAGIVLSTLGQRRS